LKAFQVRAKVSENGPPESRAERSNTPPSAFFAFFFLLPNPDLTLSLSISYEITPYIAE